MGFLPIMAFALQCILSDIRGYSRFQGAFFKPPRIGLLYKPFVILRMLCLVLFLQIGPHFITGSFSTPPVTLLDWYGFKSPKQKKAITFLLKQTEIDGKNPVINGHLTKSDLSEIMTLVNRTQKQWVRRAPKQERWDVVKNDYAPEQKKTMLRCLKILGVVHARFPLKSSTSSAICVLGATGPAMNKRLKFLECCIEKGLFRRQNILLLSGERPLQSRVDDPEYNDLIQKKGPNSKEVGLERDLLQHLYDSSPSAKHQWPVIVIHGKKGDLPRATTESTVKTLLNWLKKHPEIKTIVFISSQPYALYQKAIIGSVFKSCGSDLNVQVVGDGAKPKEVHQLLAELGSYIWAITPSVLSSIPLPKLSDVDQQNLSDFLNTCYGAQKSLYQILPKKLTNDLFSKQKEKVLN